MLSSFFLLSFKILGITKLTHPIKIKLLLQENTTEVAACQPKGETKPSLSEEQQVR